MSKNGVHGFDDARMKAYQDALKLSDFIEKSAAKAFSLHIARLLSQVTPALRYQTKPGVAFRAVAVHGESAALDDRATFGAGGRLNIGMKQQDPEFKGTMLKAMGGIYASQDPDTAIAEFKSAGIGAFAIVELQINMREIKLVDFDYEVDCLEKLLPAVSLISRVHAIPYAAAWKYQNFPLISQVIGNWIRVHSGTDIDGAFFHSTKRADGINYLLFQPERWSVKSK